MTQEKEKKKTQRTQEKAREEKENPKAFSIINFLALPYYTANW